MSVKNFPREVPRAISLITQGICCGKFFPEEHKAFPLFFRLWGSTTEEDAAEGLPEENPEGGFRLSLVGPRRQKIAAAVNYFHRRNFHLLKTNIFLKINIFLLDKVKIWVWAKFHQL